MSPGFGRRFFFPCAWWAALALLTVSGFGARPYQPNRGDPLLEPWRWRTFLDLSGLDAQCMAEGADGTIWFGTGDGLSSYNGVEWGRQIEGEILGGVVNAICAQPDGTLHVGGWWGISELRQGKWTRSIPAVGTRFADVRRLAAAPDGSIWAATSWGALHRQQSTWTLYTDAANAARLRQDQSYQSLKIELWPDAVLAKSRRGSVPANRNDLSEVRADRQGRIWFGTRSGEVLCYAPASTESPWSLYNESDGVIGGRAPAILPLQDGTIWVVGAPSERANTFDGKTWRTISIPAPGVAPDGGRLLQTRDGVIWLSARYVLFAYRDGQWRTYQKPEAAIPTATNLLLQSADGALWIVGPNTDIQRVDYQTPRWLTLRDLNFQWESPTGAQWFLHRDGRVVVHAGNQWTSYGAEDGVIDTPVALLGTRTGEVWAAGSHGQTAATARFDGQKWTRYVHDDFAWGVDWRAAFEAADGSVWFGASVDSSGPRQHRDGLLRFRAGVWTHHHQPGRSPQPGGVDDPLTLLPPNHRPEPIEKYYALGESRDGKIWAGRNVLVYHDGKKWAEFFPTPDVRLGIIESMFTTREGDLWIGTRQYGALRYDGREWRQFQGKGSLEANTVRSLTQTADGSIWTATDRGISRFDGRTWTASVLPEQLNVPPEGGDLKASPSGALWINRVALDWNRRAWSKAPPIDPATCEFWTICRRFDGPPPETVITAGSKIVAQPGNLAVFWSGHAPWREPQDAHLEYSHRFDDDPWSEFTSDAGHAFFALSSGRHHLEVRARDRDFNIDPTPATLDFVVLPPVWQQSWFVALMILLTGLIAAQSVRVVRERSRLRVSNRELAAEIKAREQTEEALRKLNLELDQRVTARTAQLESANKELEAFSYSVSHDLRSPLRSIDGFSRVLLEDYAAKLDEEGQDSLRRVRAASQRMGHLIDDLLQLSRTTRAELHCAPLDLTALAQEIAAEFTRSEPERRVDWVIASGLTAHADAALLRAALQNLLANAWKFTSHVPQARIEVGSTLISGERVFYVRDNGAGFDMAFVGKLFAPFQRLHTETEFPGTGVGLANVQRIVHRHGGRVWAEGQVDRGATFFFTLSDAPPETVL